MDHEIVEKAKFGLKVAQGMTWKFTAIGTNFILQFGIGIVLARILPPEDFGLVGLAWIVTGFA